MFPRTLLVLVFASLAALALSCTKPSGAPAGSADAETTTTTTSTTTGKVAFLLSTLQEERYQKDKKYFEDEAKRLGLSAFTFAADNDNARQLSQVDSALSRGAKVLVIQPTDSAAAAAYVAKAHEKGAKVIAYDRSIAGTDVDFYVAHDSHAVGVLQAEAGMAYLKSLGGKGNVVLLNGQSGHSVATEIARGYMDVLKPYIDKGDVKIVVERNHDSWSPEQALKTMEDAIAKTKGDIQVILANNSGMARGAVQATQAARFKYVFIAGADADAANVNYVCEGKQTVEVLKDIKPLAEKAAQVAGALLAGKPVEGAATTEKGKTPTVAVAVKLVDHQNARALLVDSGFHSEKSVPACAKK